ncbi:endonuclease/exonuclease/phosphatase family protein [Kribbella sp. NPDC058245]|uniref:endonuclease/exonuclease/phosphatase family protein n=1 Tax=Kribbella sp. NPDC058245 TaxID=3346399 RepID=UPI0036E38F66
MVQLTVASLNTRGMPLRGSRLGERYAAIGAVFEASDVDVVNFQEVLTYYHLRQLVRAMPSYRFVSFRRSVAGPAGGLLTLSRTAIARIDYTHFPLPAAADVVGLPRLSRQQARLKGVLVTHLAGVAVLNTHLLANFDGDWSETNRYYRLQHQQLTTLAHAVAALDKPAVITGDFNLASNSPLYRTFIQDTGLLNAFGDNCPPTFHASYLRSNQSPHCIDFLLLSDSSITVKTTQLTFTGPLPMPGGHDYLTDHLGLQAHLTL